MREAQEIDGFPAERIAAAWACLDALPEAERHAATAEFDAWCAALGVAPNGSRTARAAAALSAMRGYAVESGPREHAGAPFPAGPVCCAADFAHPLYWTMCGRLGLPPIFDRRYWEWAVVARAVAESEVVEPGARGVGFGASAEPLPALFAQWGASVLAAGDPPFDLFGRGAGRGALRRPEVIDDATFDARVDYRPGEPLELLSEVRGADFVWSCGVAEKSGDPAAALGFVEASTERCLRPGGLSAHTLAVWCPAAGVEPSAARSAAPSAPILLAELAAFIERLRDRGHGAWSLPPPAPTRFLDVFEPPAGSEDPPALRVAAGLGRATSAVVVIRRY